MHEVAGLVADVLDEALLVAHQLPDLGQVVPARGLVASGLDQDEGAGDELGVPDAVLVLLRVQVDCAQLEIARGQLGGEALLDGLLGVGLDGAARLAADVAVEVIGDDLGCVGLGSGRG